MSQSERRLVIHRKFRNPAIKLPVAPGRYEMVSYHYLTSIYPNVGESFDHYMTRIDNDKELIDTKYNAWVVE